MNKKEEDCGVEHNRLKDHKWLTDPKRTGAELVSAWDFYMEMVVFTSHLVEAKTGKDVLKKVDKE